VLIRRGGGPSDGEKGRRGEAGLAIARFSEFRRRGKVIEGEEAYLFGKMVWARPLWASVGCIGGKERGRLAGLAGLGHGEGY
jgi:hypothetical protein